MDTGKKQRERKLHFLEHLEELRRRIIYCLISILILSVLSFIFSSKIIKILSHPIESLYFFTPTEAFFVKVKVSIVCGFVLSLPVIIYHIWSFIIPALIPKEKKYAAPLVVSSSILFLVGASFSYFIIIPIGLKVLLSFGGAELVPLIGVSKYLNFILWLLVSFGIVFELPVVIFFLTKLGVVETETLKAKRKHAILLIFILAAVLTPTVDFVTQILMGIPLILLYEISILVSRLSKK